MSQVFDRIIDRLPIFELYFHLLICFGQLSDIFIGQLQLLSNLAHVFALLHESLILNLKLLEVPLIFLHVLDLFCQFSDLLSERFHAQLVVPLALGKLVDLDVSFALSFPRLVLRLDQLRGHYVLVLLSQPDLFDGIFFCLKSLLQLLDLPDMAVLHKDQALVLFGQLSQVGALAGNFLLKFDQVRLRYLHERLRRGMSLQKGQLGRRLRHFIVTADAQVIPIVKGLRSRHIELFFILRYITDATFIQ